jgi:hypothetical protein
MLRGKFYAATAVAGTAAVAFAGTSAAADNSIALRSASQLAAATGVALHIPVVVDSPNSGIFCSDIAVTVHYRGAQGRRHTVTRTVRPVPDVQVTTLTVPARRLSVGMLHYVVTARQSCGLPTSITHFAGRAPQNGQYSVRVLAP